MTETQMRRLCLMTAGMLGLAAGPGLAQTPPGVNPQTGARPGNEIGTGQSLPLGNRPSNITPGDTRSVIAPRLPSPPGGQNESPRQFLMDARNALASNQTGMAQEALERAETGVLDRSVDPRYANIPSRQPVVQTITQALQALAGRDIASTQRLIDVALGQLQAAPPQ
jgi:hypothetical protein